MEIRIRLFAGLRDLAGTGNITLALEDDARVADALTALTAHLPALELPDGLTFAVNQHYVAATTLLRDGDELALIPPVSGG